MSRSEKAVITVLCMVYQSDKILLQNRVKEDWKGLTFPGGHVKKKESFVGAVIREVKEETGLLIKEPKLCGLKQFQTDDDERYVVILFKTDKFEGELVSSEEGEMLWLERGKLTGYNLASDFLDLLEVFEEESLTEFYYQRDPKDDWKIKIY